ncbi:LytR/AlgR family response regulator transcription factor [Siphonobacter aquaeclarae]|uniref:Two component transcriptional regulator, LytTR family n=1 Tax=Siphonobacter aquaeclarae TaxID=563176 RepID=A0A1G9HZJ5_9BACT|nr:LytTR family DNA-binding domain-containing protein [Siphonobacter aquaeclarae]SDL18094.1 two component transcriptional regulator, LytTR family [Siphonobacter aquaeclarae]
MNALIVEDEELAVRKLKKLLNEVAPDMEIVGNTGSIEDTITWLEQRRVGGLPDPDLLFLDIELADGQSFEIFERTPVRSTVIFTTSYDEYALQAFRVNSIDYLLKPVQRDELKRSLQKYEDLRGKGGTPGAAAIELLLQQLHGHFPKSYRQRFLVRQGMKMLSLEIKEVAYFYTEERYSFLTAVSGHRYLVDYTLDELEAMLNPSDFFRINRGAIVTHQAVEQIQPYFGNRLILNLKPVFDKEALVSREKVTDFKLWMGK